MEKVPTAEEFLISKNMPGFAKHTVVTQWMAEFAKMHVEAALKEACKQVEVVMFGNSPLTDDASILRSYPLTNIK
jgi:hypothetical protein